MEENTQKNSAVWYTVGAIIIVIAAYLLFFKSPTETIAPTDDMTATSTSAVASSTDVTLMVTDQFSTSTVTVGKVTTKNPVWVTVYNDKNGKPGSVLTAAWIPAGEHDDLVIDLNPIVATEGQTYYVIIHADDGTAGFNYKTDLPLNDASGKPVMKSYKVIFSKG